MKKPLLLCLAMLLFACSLPAQVKKEKAQLKRANANQLQSNSANPVLAHWSQIVGHIVNSPKDRYALKMVARFVVNGSQANCQQFSLKPVAANGSPTPPTAAVARSLPVDAAFKITVCQFEMSADWQSANLYESSSSRPLATFPGPYAVGRQHQDSIIAIGIGDTGCRADDCDANGGVNLNFKTVIDEIVAKNLNPDLVLHVGDFRYYKENKDPDSWDKWFMEFFRPAQPLLNTTPIAVVRGNHEECDGTEGYWYGQRWYQFFEATTSSKVTTCYKNSATLEDPWYFHIASKSNSSNSPQFLQRIFMIDNSPDIGNFNGQNFDLIIDTMKTNFSQVMNLQATTMDTWWVMHKPLWNYPFKYSSKGTQTAVLNALGAQQSLGSGLCPNQTCNPRAIMSGHAHMYQKVYFDNEHWPIQYVLGHGGVHTLQTGDDSAGTPSEFKSPSTYPKSYSFDGILTKIYRQNGFLIWIRDAHSLSRPSGWLTQNCLVNDGCRVVSP